MTRKIERTYEFSEREVREALLFWLKSKDLPHPKYIADVDGSDQTVRWGGGNGGITIRWTETDEVEP